MVLVYLYVGLGVDVGFEYEDVWMGFFVGVVGG